MTQQRNIELNENNDEKVNFELTTNVPVADTVLNITGMTLEMYLKPSKATADDGAGVWKGTSTAGDLVITDGPNGECYALVPASAVTMTQTFYKVDTLSGGKRKTSVYGDVAVTDL